MKICGQGKPFLIGFLFLAFTVHAAAWPEATCSVCDIKDKPSVPSAPLRPTYKIIPAPAVLAVFSQSACKVCDHHDHPPVKISHNDYVHSGWFGQVGLGAAFNTTGITQELALSNQVTNQYSAHHDLNTNVIADVSAGYRFDAWSWGQLALSEQGDYVNYGSIGGIEYPALNLNNANNTLNYRYDASSYLLLTNATVFLGDRIIRPFIDAGVGVAWNQMTHFSETENTGNAAPMSVPFSNNTQVDVAYAVGVGVSYLVNRHMDAALAYRYVNPGEASLGSTPYQTTNAHLESGTLSSNTIELRLSFM